MSEGLILEIKQQPFEPPFVLQVGGEELPAYVGKLDDNHVVARISDKGNYKIDVSDVGFFFVEKKAEPYKGRKVLQGFDGGILNRTLRATAKSLGEHCGDVITELEFVRGVLFPRRLTINGRGG